MTAPIFDQARKRGTHDKVGQLNPMGRYGVAEGASRQLYLFEVKLSILGRRDCERYSVPGLRCVSFFHFQCCAHDFGQTTQVM